MKKIIFSLLIILFLLVGCSNLENVEKSSQQTEKDMQQSQNIIPSEDNVKQDDILSKKQMIDKLHQDLKNNNEIIEITSQNIYLNKGELKQIFLGFYNTQDYTTSFTIKIKESSTCNKEGLLFKNSPTQVIQKEIVTLPMNIKSESIIKSTCFYDLEVQYGIDLENKEIVQLTINSKN